MDGRNSRRPARVLHVDRTSEQTRLHDKLMAAAYERVRPIVRRTLADEALRRTVERDQRHLTPPARAAGACA